MMTWPQLVQTEFAALPLPELPRFTAAKGTAHSSGTPLTSQQMCANFLLGKNKIIKKKKNTQKNNRKKSDKRTAREKAGLADMPICAEAAQKRRTCRRSLDGVLAPCYDIRELQPAGQGSSNELPSHSKPGLATPHLPSTGSPNN